jgi:hypothetical protein
MKECIRNPQDISSCDELPIDVRATGGGESNRQTTAFEHWLLEKMLERLGDPPLTFSAWDGWMVTNEKKNPASGSPEKSFNLRLHDAAALWRLVFDPEYQFGELYSSGRLTVEGDLASLIESIFFAQQRRPSQFSRLLRHLHPPRSNLYQQAKTNIHHHYDIGEAFYRLWLDPQLIYTCAYFPSPSASLEDAQWEKMDLICLDHMASSLDKFHHPLLECVAHPQRQRIRAAFFAKQAESGRSMMQAQHGLPVTFWRSQRQFEMPISHQSITVALE